MIISGYKNDIQAFLFGIQNGSRFCSPLCVNDPKTKLVMYTPEMTFKEVKLKMVGLIDSYVKQKTCGFLRLK